MSPTDYHKYPLNLTMFEATQTYLTSLVEPFYSQEWSYEDIFNYSKKPHRCLFGFGNTSPWQLDILADPVQPFTTRQVQLFGYVKAVPTPVLSIAEEEKDNYPEVIEVLGQYYIPIAADQTVIEENGCHQIMFRGKLDHDKIKASATPESYRSVGLYKGVEYTTDNEALLAELFSVTRSPIIDVKQATGELFHLRHLATPSFITPRLVEDIIEVVSFTKYS